MNITHNDFVKKIFNNLEITVCGSGYAEVSDDWHAENVCSPFSRIYYIVSGEGFLKSETQFLKLTAGRCYFIPLGLTYDYWCSDNLCQLYFHINATEPGGKDLFENAASFSEFEPKKHIIDSICDMYLSNSFQNSFYMKAYLELALAEFIKNYRIQGFSEDNYSPEIFKAVQYIGNNPSVRLTTAEIADSLFISASKLSKEFKHETGMPIGKYIDDLIFQKAVFLLSKTERSVKSISDELGFCDQFYFSRRFRQRFDETPLAYRKRVKVDGKI